MRIGKWMLFLFLFGNCYAGYGQERKSIDTLEVQVFFRQGYSILEPAFRNNEERLTAFVDQVRLARQDTLCRVKGFRVVGTASPEGIDRLNRRLSENRAKNIIAWFEDRVSYPGTAFEVQALGVDWAGLTELVEASDMPWRDEVLDILHHTPEWIIRNGKVVDGRVRQLGMLRGGIPWRYMQERFFPELRSAGVRLTCEIERRDVSLPAPQTAPQAEPTPQPESQAGTNSHPEPEPQPVAVREVVAPSSSRPGPFYMALKTNLLYDAALVPNIGAEFYVGRGWSVGGNWMYAWWNSDRRHNYWRTYGGELDIRKYFGRRALAKPLTGHHLGLYGQMLTYDFETGGTGFLSKLSYGVGIEYGYSLPVGRRLNLDFGIGIGYLGGEYKKYDPIDGHYVWKETRQRHWFGPTKAEISLVWLLGRGNYNEKKGGAR